MAPSECMRFAALRPWLLLLVVSALTVDPPSVAQEPPDTNYDEAKVPEYELPDPLVCLDGRKVSDAAMWRRRALLLAQSSRATNRPSPVPLRLVE